MFKITQFFVYTVILFHASMQHRVAIVTLVISQSCNFHWVIKRLNEYNVLSHLRQILTLTKDMNFDLAVSSTLIWIARIHARKSFCKYVVSLWFKCVCAIRRTATFIHYFGGKKCQFFASAQHKSWNHVVAFFSAVKKRDKLINDTCLIWIHFKLNGNFRVVEQILRNIFQIYNLLFPFHLTVLVKEEGTVLFIEDEVLWYC